MENRNPDRATESCLVLMLKSPGRSKQRLAASIGPLAAIAAEHLCYCAFEDMAAWPGPVCFAPADEHDGGWLAARISPADAVVPQRGRNLGERINHVNRTLRMRGFERQIFIGIDCPELDERYLEQAADALGDHDVVLGPALDGGVVLMGVRHEWPDLGELAWSSTRLMADLEQFCNALGWRMARLAPLADVDTFEDLDALKRVVGEDARPARRALGAWLANDGHRPETQP
ncbi:TIGR04282 family arsenosugar biosynthesis glycosyltransferase [Candidatus Rariloculus sp.]|uniref:TIGR04282 family arsenosugar biosynthesis glycosyltransferase n=1 Tax=Candidatus Rariloculus sp. TaxID=3101265 RepID=UPI003D0DBB90